jgi:type II secretory ATPase GspE/PulE/Tfp pilus assembly ATPase PilB-like protein
MLPKHHYDSENSSVYNDSNWISEQIDQLPISMQKKVTSKYSDIYLQLTKEEDRKVRFRVNTWLRKTVEKNKITNTEGYF